MYLLSFAHRDTTIKNAHHRPFRDWMAASRSRTRDAMIFFVGCCVAQSCILCRNQPSLSSLLAIQRTKVRSLPLSHDQQRLLLSSFDGQHENFDCCILSSRDGWITVVAPRQYDCFPQHQKMKCCCVFAMIDMLSHAITALPFGIWCKNTLVVVASCNTTCKIYFASLANDNKFVRSSWYNVHWLALCDTMWSLLAHLLAHAIWWKNCIIVVCSSRYNIIIRLLCVVIARGASSLHPCNVAEKKRCRCFSRYDKKYALASDGIKAEWSCKNEATSQRLRVWWAFWPPFLKVRFSRQGWKRVKRKELVVR